MPTLVVLVLPSRRIFRLIYRIESSLVVSDYIYLYLLISYRRERYYNSRDVLLKLNSLPIPIVTLRFRPRNLVILPLKV